MADRHAERCLPVGHQFGQQAHVLRPHDLGQHEGRDPGHDGGSDVGHGEVERTIDADGDVGATLGDAGHRRGQGGARGGLIGRDDRVLEIEDDGIGAAGMGLGDEAFGQHRHEQQRSPGRGRLGHGGCSSRNRRAGTACICRFCRFLLIFLLRWETPAEKSGGRFLWVTHGPLVARSRDPLRDSHRAERRAAVAQFFRAR